MNDNAKEKRKQKRLEVLGSNYPVCIVCGEDAWQCLEQHHIAGQHFSDDLCNVCRNCHRKLSDNQKDHPKPTENITSLETIGHLLLGLADFFELLIKRLKECGEFLIQTAFDNGVKYDHS